MTKKSLGKVATRRHQGGAAVLVPVPGERAAFTRKVRDKIQDAGEAYFDLPPADKPGTRRARAVNPNQLKFAFMDKGAQCQRLPESDEKYTFAICGEADSFEIRSYFDGRRAGTVRLYDQDDGTMKVGWSDTEQPAYYRLLYPDTAMPAGLGTKLYERALRAACDVGGQQALVSDKTRSPFSEAFWRKQVRKGRASCVGDGSESSYYDSPMSYARSHFRERFGRDFEDTKEWQSFMDKLPEPEEGGDGYHWPCDYYKIKCRNRPDSLAGVRYAIKSDRKGRKR